MNKKNLLFILPLLFGLASCDGDITSPSIDNNCDHQWSTQWTVDIAPTCTVNGSKSHHCLLCDAKADVTDIPALGHDFGEWVVYREPTCKNPGEERRTCSRCDEYESRPIARTEHTLTNPVYYWNEEYTELTGMAECSECGQMITETVGSTREIVSGSCETGGVIKVTSKAFQNSVFEVQYKEVTIPATGHDWSTEWTIDKEATCTEDGQKSHHCNRCGQMKDIEVIPALGHEYGDWTIIKEPSFNEDGERERTCSRCGNVEKESIEKLEPFVFQTFKDSFNVSKPTKVDTNMVYAIEKLGLSLNNTSTLTLQYGDVINAKYDYSSQKLNPIGSEELITTTTGTYYSKGSSIGEVNNGLIVWNEEVESSISFLNVNFDETLFDNYVIEYEKFTGAIANDKLEQFFGTQYNISDFTIEITLNANKSATISSVKLNYTDSKTNAKISTTINYSYDLVIVEIPE